MALTVSLKLDSTQGHRKR